MPTPTPNIPANSYLKYEQEGDQSIITGNSPVPGDHPEGLLKFLRKIEELSHSNWLVHPLGKMIITILILNTIIITLIITSKFLWILCAPFLMVYVLFFFLLKSMSKFRNQGAAAIINSNKNQSASWELTVSSSQIRYHYGEYSQKADETVINSKDIKNFNISPEGFLSVELISSQSVNTQSANITGILSPQDQEWLLEHCSHHIKKQPTEEQSYSQSIKVKEAGPTPKDLKIIEDTPSSLILTSSTTVRSRIFSTVATVIVAFVIYYYFKDYFISLFFREAQSVTEFLDKSPLYWKLITAVSLIIIPCSIIYSITWKIFGKNCVQANGQGIKISRKALGLGTTHNIPRTQIKSLKQITWTVSSGGSNSKVRIKHWNLEIEGNRTINILDKSKKHSFETVDWLGRRLSNILSIPYTKAYEDE